MFFPCCQRPGLNQISSQLFDQIFPHTDSPSSESRSYSCAPIQRNHYLRLLSSVLPMGQKPSTQKHSTMRPVKETITYPRIKVTAENDPCLNPSQEVEHILSCGHIITSATANELCGSNCYHVAARKQRVGTQSAADFWCNACVEERIEAEIAKENTNATVAGTLQISTPQLDQLLTAK